MKKKVLYSMVIALALVGCDYNEDNFEGFDELGKPTDIKKTEYTLTDADYKAIASNSENKAIALAYDPVDSTVYKALQNITSSKAFTSTISAHEYIPAYLNTLYATADPRSSVKVTYNEEVGCPAYLDVLAAAGRYTLKSSDYENVWGSTVKASYLSPATATDATFSTILSEAKPQAKEGDIVMVNYNYSNVEPSIGGGSGEETAKPYYKKVNAITEAGAYLLVATVNDVNYAFADLADPSKSYGYTLGAEVEISDNQIKADDVTNALALSVEQGAKGYTMKNSRGKYIYMSGTYNSFNFSDKVGEAGYNWNFNVNADGTFNIANVENNKVIAYSPSYASFGAYADLNSLYVVSVYQYVDPNAVVAYSKVTTFDGPGTYLMVANTGDVKYAFADLADPSKSYGYALGSEVNVDKNMILSEDATDVLALAIDAMDQGYSIRNSRGKYIYMSGTFNSFNFADAIGAEGYNWTFNANADGTFDVTNVATKKTIAYSANFSSFGAYASNEGNFVVELYKKGTVSTSKKSVRSVVPRSLAVAYNACVLYQFNGSSWAVMDKYTDEENDTEVKVAALDPSVYNNLGEAYVASPDNILPQYLSLFYPYVSSGQVMAVAYYAKGGGIAVDEYTNEDGSWSKTTEVQNVTSPFTKADAHTWKYDPSVLITLPPTKSNEMTVLYMQTATDWVWENIDQKLLGVQDKGNGYVTKFGNNEYYTGCSAYYGNVDMRAAKAKEQYAKGYEGMSDEEIYDAMCQHLIEVMGPVLEILNPDATPVDGVDVTYTVQVGIYTGKNVSSVTHQLAYKVISKGKFEYVPDSFQPIAE